MLRLGKFFLGSDLEKNQKKEGFESKSDAFDRKFMIFVFFNKKKKVQEKVKNKHWSNIIQLC